MSVEIGKWTMRLNLTAIILLICSCTQIDMIDSSSDPKYSWIVDQQLIVREKIWATAVTDDANYKPPATYISLAHGVGFVGSEVIFREQCCLGARIIIVKVLTSKWSMLSRIEYVVEGKELEKYNLNSTISVRGEVDDGNLGLNPTVYIRNNKN